MTTRLDKTLKREVTIEGRTFILAVSPEGLKLTLKGKRKGQELRWSDLVNGDAALAAALNASVGTFEAVVPASANAKAAEPIVERPRRVLGGRRQARSKSKRASRARKV